MKHARALKEHTIDLQDTEYNPPAAILIEAQALAPALLRQYPAAQEYLTVTA
jgi:hypothetical protein